MTEGSTTRTAESPDLREQDVAVYLEEHPDFFATHEYLLAELSVPHPDTGQAVSLIERQIAMLRQQNRELGRKLDHIAQTARSNELLLERMEELILDIIDSPDLDSVLQVLDGAMRTEFQADAVAIFLFAKDRTEAPFVAPDSEGLQEFAGLLSGRRPACGDLSPTQKSYLFGSRADEMASGAILPLCEGRKSDCIGLLGIGSTDPERFHSEMGTVFLAHLGAVAAKVIRNRIGP